MRIAIDAHSVGTRQAGNESYATNLIEALAEIDSVNQYTLFVTKREAVDRFDNRWPNFKVRLTLPHTPVIRIPLTLSAELRKNPVDLLHVQFTAPPFTPCRLVVTVHDLSFEHLPVTFKRRSRAQLRLTVKRSVRRATQVITPSTHTRLDIIETYGVAPERVSMIPLAASARFAPVSNTTELQRVRDTYGIEGDYILSVGSIQPRKNLRRLIASYSLLCQAESNRAMPKLVLVGKRAWLYDETLKAIQESGLLSSIIIAGYVPERDLPALYSGAICFVYPSFFEGFGLPPLEAMKCGTPVIVGDRTSLPEVVADAGVQVDPFDVGALANALRLLINNPDLRRELRVKGLVRASKFDWRETARRTLEIYQNAVSVDGAAKALEHGAAG